MGEEGFEPPKIAQQIYSLPPLATWVLALRFIVQMGFSAEH